MGGLPGRVRLGRRSQVRGRAAARSPDREGLVLSAQRWPGGRIALAVLVTIAAEVVIYWGALAGLAWLEGGDGGGRSKVAATAAYAAPAILLAQVAVPIVVYRLFRPRGPDAKGRRREDIPRLPNALDR